MEIGDKFIHDSKVYTFVGDDGGLYWGQENYNSVEEAKSFDKGNCFTIEEFVLDINLKLSRLEERLSLHIRSSEGFIEQEML